MSQIDDFAQTLLEESKRFFEKAEEGGDQTATDAYLHAALMLAFCSLEAHVNAISDDFLARADISVHDKGILSEQEVRLEKGAFKITTTLKMTRLEDRIQFLHVRFSGKQIDHSQIWWSQLSEAVTLRNHLTHPKDIVVITKDAVGRAIRAMIDTLDALYQAIYKSRFPPASRGLDSRLTY